MKKVSIIKSALLGAVSGIISIALFSLGYQLALLPFFPFDLFDKIARILPGRFMTVAIDTLVEIVRKFKLGPAAASTKLAEQGLALILFTFIWFVFGLVLGIVGRRRPKRLPRFSLLGGGLLLVVAVWIEAPSGFAESGVIGVLIWLGATLVGGGYLLGWLIRTMASRPALPPRRKISRRLFLYLVGIGSFTVAVTAAGVTLLSNKKDDDPGPIIPEEKKGASETSGPAASPPMDVLEKRFKPIPGTRPELTDNRDFYRIDINLRPPRINGDTWRLKVEGLVERPLSLSLKDLRSRRRQTQAITLSCISNPIGGDLISSSFWTGVPFADILEEAGLKEGAQEVFIQSVDGFYESVSLDEAQDARALLVYEMGGQPLSVEHGFPLRVFIPGHYGMKQPKWIARMEVIDHKGPGYWVDRGWSERAIPQTTSVIDVVATRLKDPDSGFLPVGGIAYAGARGISRVEIQVDGGPWEKAELREPPLSPLTWVQWRYFWKARPGKHEFRVRAYDGMGTLQTEKKSPPHPDGATGYHSITADAGR
jgi:DMSO/TMAO reductase YedYZ molybdopterin-dependent catalytic subunit